MEPYYSLVYAFGLSFMTEETERELDIVGKLPVEIGIMILRMLDPKSLMSAALVNKKWLSLCHADKTLEAKILSRIQKKRTSFVALTPFAVTVMTKTVNPFTAPNGRREMTVSRVSEVSFRPTLPNVPRRQPEFHCSFSITGTRKNETMVCKNKSTKHEVTKRNKTSKGKKIRL